MGSRLVTRALWQSSGVLLPWVEAQPQRQRGLILFLIDGLFIGISNAFIATYIPLYALALGASGAQVGLLTAIQSGAMIVGSATCDMAVRRLRSRKKVSLYFHRMLEQFMAIPLIAIPLLLAGPAAVYAVMVIQMVRSFLMNLGAPAWAAFVPLVVPLEIRGRYMSVRSIIKFFSGVVVPPIAGLIIVTMGGFQGYQIVFALSMTTGLLAASFYGRIPEPPLEKLETRRSGLGLDLRRMWHEPFGRFVVGVSLWTVTSAIATPFYVVYMSKDLRLGADAIGALIAFATAAQTASLAFLGGTLDRRGAPWLLSVSAMALAVVPLGWLLVHQWWQTLPLYFVSGVATAGYGLASLNALLEVTPEDGRSAYIGAYYTLTATAGTLAPLIGSWCFSSFGFRGSAAMGGLSSLIAAALLGTLLSRQRVSRLARVDRE